jgi:hypothetical protein
MTRRSSTLATVNWIAGALALVAGAYAGYVGITWLRFRHPEPSSANDADPFLDQFMPVYDVVERHHIGVAAPADVTFAAACEADLLQSPAVRAIFKTREKILGSEPGVTAQAHGILAFTKAIGWGVLAEVPGREVVMGAVTKPWEANVVFRPLPPDEFARFNEPGYVKIAWTIRADAKSATDSVFRTETRAVATDAMARTKFRRYWSMLSPGIIAIRWIMLRPVKAEAERRAAAARQSETDAVAPLATESESRS